MKQGNTLFAFKLVEQKQQAQAQNSSKWTVRDGIAIAGCTANGDPFDPDTILAYTDWESGGYDAGAFC